MGIDRIGAAGGEIADAAQQSAGDARRATGAAGNFLAPVLGMSANATDPGASSPFWHRHGRLEELYVFLEGHGQMALDDEVVEVTAGTVVRVAPETWRAVHSAVDADRPLKWLCLRGGGDGLAEIGRDGELDRERPFPWAA